jgi:hypothetical protein
LIEAGIDIATTGAVDAAVSKRNADDRPIAVFALVEASTTVTRKRQESIGTVVVGSVHLSESTEDVPHVVQLVVKPL